MEEKKTRKNHIDLIETLAMFLVILYHTSIYSGNYLNDSRISNYIIYFLKTILSTGAPLFFFVNGYLLLNKNLNLKKHIIKTIKLLLLTLFWAVMGVFIIMHIVNTPLTTKEFLQYCWTFKPIGWINHLWYMGSLICIYIFFPLIKEVYDNNKKVFHYILIVCFILVFGNSFLCSIATIVTNLFLKTGKIISINLFNIFNPLREIHGYALVYFCLGGWLYNYEEKIKNSNIVKRLVLPIVGFIICVLMSGGIGLYYTNITKEFWDPVWTGYETIFTLGIVVCIYIISLNYSSNNKYIYYISTCTLGIYFIHSIIIKLVKQYVTISNLLMELGIAFLILNICLLIILIMRKLPLVRKLIS